MTPADWFILAAYFALLVGITAWSLRRSRETAADYFLADRDLGWVVVGASIFASNIGSEHLVGLAGAGATSGTQPDGVNYALKKGVIVVTTTRTGSGRIAPSQGRGGRGGGPPADNPSASTAEELRRRIAGEDLAPVKARVLLMLALTRTQDPEDVQRIFSEY